MAETVPPEAATGKSPSIARLIWRAIRRRCPACGVSPIFRGWFAMHQACPTCGRLFQRDPGYLLGSIYFNYGVTATIVVVAYFAGYFSELVTSRQLLVALSVFSLVFPLWFFRYARALWIAFDELFDPWQPSDKSSPAASDKRNVER